MEAIGASMLDKGKSYFNLDTDLRSLENKMQRLSARKSDIELEVTNAERSGTKKRKRAVVTWFEQVAKVENEFRELKKSIQEGGRLEKVRSGGRVATMDTDVQSLLDQSFDGLVLEAFESGGVPRVTTKLFGDMFDKGMKEIYQWLVTDRISNIGIYGMGGVGKTTLAKHIHNHLLEKPQFKVYWITVSQEFSIKRLQDDLAKCLGLDLSQKNDEDHRAVTLSGALVKHSSVLILDDVWKQFSFEKIGIPVGANKCRVILTTRSKELCDRISCQRIFEAKTLTTSEAWNLFIYTLEPKTALHVDVEKTAKAVAEECAGLPLGIITVAGSMKGISDICEWRNALNQLKACSVGYDEMERDVFPILEWSFNRLNECLKPCFLYCCLYPEDSKIKINELIDLFIWAELIPIEYSRSKDFDRGHTMLNKLIRACLLEETTTDWEKNKCVRMHDLVRDMALRITNGNSTVTMSGGAPRFLVKSIGQGISTERLEPKEWTENLHAVSYSSYTGKQFEVPLDWSQNCPELSTLLLSGFYTKGSLNSFFMGMSGLKVLKLSHCTSIVKLPNSVSDMVNLTALILNSCQKLQSVPSLEKLKKLRELNLFSTAIQDLPQGFESLVSLESLNLKQCDSFRQMMIPEGTFSKLDRLQRLELPTYSTIQVNDREVLNQLEILEGYFLFTDFYKISRWPKCVYRLRISEFSTQWEGGDLYKISKLLEFRECNLGRGLNYHVAWLPDDLEVLRVWKCVVRGIGCLSDAFKNLMSLNSLSRLDIRDLKGIEFLLQLSSDPAPPLLPNLQKLVLENLPNLVGLFDGGSQAYLLPRGTFSSLTKLKIVNCDNIKQLLPLQLRVKHCEGLEEIAVDDDGVEHGGRGDIQSTSTESAPTIALPKLRLMHLLDLPKLKNICSAAMICDSIQEIWIRGCPNVKRLPLFLPTTINGQPSPPSSLRVIEGGREWWESLEWHNSYAKSALDPFFTARS